MFLKQFTTIILHCTKLGPVIPPFLYQSRYWYIYVVYYYTTHGPEAVE